MLIYQVNPELLEKVPAIIEAAARSALGIIALLALVLTLLAYALFRDSSEWARLVAFVGLLMGAVLFTFAAFTVAPQILVSGNGSDSSESVVVESTIWRVDGDWKGQVVAAEQFIAAESTPVAYDSLAHAVATWIQGELRIPTDQGPVRSIQLIVSVPAHLEAGIAVATNPEVPFNVSTWDVRLSGKVRLPISGQDLGSRSEPFVLEIDIPKYGTHTIQVTPCEPRSDSVTILGGLNSVRIGVESFEGEVGFGAALTRSLLATPGINAVSPASLDGRRDVLQREREAIAENPMVQMDVRSSLGVDYIVGGTARRSRH